MCPFAEAVLGPRNRGAREAPNSLFRRGSDAVGIAQRLRGLGYFPTLSRHCRESSSSYSIDGDLTNFKSQRNNSRNRSLSCRLVDVRRREGAPSAGSLELISSGCDEVTRVNAPGLGRLFGRRRATSHLAGR